MGVTSIRLNEKEEELLNTLKEHYNCDSSTLIKRSLWEMYEDIKDFEIIEEFEKRDKNKKSEFMSFDKLIKGARNVI